MPGRPDWRDTPVGGYEAIAAIARSNQELAGEYAGPDAVFHLLDEVQRESARLERAIADFASDAKELGARLEGLGRSFAAGTLIAQGIDELPSAASHRASIDRRRASISELQLRILALARQLRPLERDLPGESALIVSKLPNLRAADRVEAVQAVNKLLEARLRILRPLLHDLEQYLNGLVEMQARQVAYLTDIREMERYLRSRQPWVRNSPRVTAADLPAAGRGLLALSSAGVWAGGRPAVRAAVRDKPGQAACVLSTIVAAAVTLVFLHRWRRRRARQRAAPTGRRSSAIILGMATVNGLACATTVLTLAWWLTGIPGAPIGLRALGNGFLDIALGVFVAGLLGALFARAGGVGSINASLGASGGRIRVALWHMAGILALLVMTRVLTAAEVGAAGAECRGRRQAIAC